MFDPDWEKVKELVGLKDDNCPKCGAKVYIDGPSLDIVSVSCGNLGCGWGSSGFNPLTIWGTAGYLILDESGLHEPDNNN